MSQPQYPLLHKAIKLAVKAHKNQDRDGSNPLPYITHPIEVLSLVRLEAGIEDEAVLCAAVLHDLLEETDVTAKEIEKKFGAATHDLVCELTREELPDTEKLPVAQRWKIKSDRMIEEIDRMSPTAKTLKLADRLSNLRSNLRTRTGEKRDRYVIQSRQILEHIDRKICPSLWDQIEKLVSGVEQTKAAAEVRSKVDGVAEKPAPKAHHANGAQPKSSPSKKR